jgi:preprotein translocase subunit SecY
MRLHQMALTQRRLFSIPEFMTRLAVTLGALAIYRLGAYLPLAGIDQAALANLLNQGSPLAMTAQGRATVFGLGVTPIISTLVLVEVARLASSRFNDWAGATPANARRVDHYVLIGSLLLAAVQGYGIAAALEEARNLVDEPGLQFRLMVVATLVAATALLVWLAALISRHGVGSGVWILLLAPYLADLPSLALSVHEAVHSGIMSAAGLVAVLAYVLIALATVAAVGRTLVRSGMPLDRTLIWPLYIAIIPAGVLVIAPWFFPAGPMRDMAAALLNRGTPLYLAALAVIVILTSLAQWQRVEPRPAVAEPSWPPVEGVGASLIILTALTLAAITIVPELLTTQLGLPMLIDGRLMTAIVAVALAMMDLLWRDQA